MRIHLTSVFVDDQDKALDFYTDVLGFIKKTEIPLGEDKWLTVVSPENPDGTELLLEPSGHPPSGRSKMRWSRTGSPSPRSPSTTCAPSTSVWPLGRPLHPGSDGDGAGDHRGARRHLRQSDPDRQSGLTLAYEWLAGRRIQAS